MRLAQYAPMPAVPQMQSLLDFHQGLQGPLCCHSRRKRGPASMNLFHLSEADIDHAMELKTTNDCSEPFPAELKVSLLEQINGCVKWICGPKRKLAKVQRNDQCRTPPGEIDRRRKGCYSVLSCWIGHLLVQLLLSRS